MTTNLQTAAAVLFVSIIGFLPQTSDAQLTVRSQYTFNSLDDLWQQNITDGTFHAEWFQGLLQSDVKAVTTEEQADDDCVEDDFLDFEDDFGGPAFGCTSGSTDGEAAAELYFPVRGMPKAAKGAIYRRKVMLNLYLSRAEKFAGNGFVCADLDGTVRECTSEELSQKNNELSLLNKRQRSVQAELFLINILEYFSESTLPGKCLRQVDARDLMERINISVSFLLFPEDFIDSNIYDSYTTVSEKFENDILSALACQVRQTQSREELKQRIASELIVPRLIEEFTALRDDNEELITGAGSLIDYAGVESTVSSLADDAAQVLQLQQHIADAEANIEMVTGDALSYRSLARPALEAIDWPPLKNLNSAKPEAIANLENEFDRFVQLTRGGIEELQSVDSLEAPSVDGLTCEGLLQSFDDFIENITVVENPYDEESDDDADEEEKQPMTIAEAEQEFMIDYDLCLERILEIAAGVSASTSETKMTAEFGRRLFELSHCVAVKQRDKDASCVLASIKRSGK